MVCSKANDNESKLLSHINKLLYDQKKSYDKFVLAREYVYTKKISCVIFQGLCPLKYIYLFLNFNNSKGI